MAAPFGVARAAVDLEHAVDDAPGRLGGEELDHGAVAPPRAATVSASAAASRSSARAAASSAAESASQPLHPLELADRLAELVSVAGVRDAQLESVGSNADCPGGDGQPPEVESVKREPQSFAFGADPVRCGMRQSSN